MTNKEYIEKNNISFSEAMKMYDNEKYPCINDWLNLEHKEHKFKVGDFVVYLYDPHSIRIVIDVKDYVYYKILNRKGKFESWGGFFSNNNLYHREEHDVFYMANESEYKKIF